MAEFTARSLHHHDIIPPNNPYGQLSAATVDLHVPKLIHLQLVTYLHGYAWARFTDSEKKTISLTAENSLDYDLSARQLQNMDIYALVLARHTTDRKVEEYKVYYLCLLVTRSGNRINDHTYRRMGTVMLDEQAMGSHIPQKTDRIYVTLV